MNKELKYYNATGEQAPSMYLDTTGKYPTWILNPAASEEWRIEHGFIFTTKPVTGNQPEETSEDAYVAFKAACVQFRMICDQIAEKADLPGFTGGFDEMFTFKQTPAYSTIEGLQLATDWIAANELCKYEGAKLGYTQPGWWYRCWDYKEIAELEEEANVLALERHARQLEGDRKAVETINSQLLVLWDRAQPAINRYDDTTDISRHVNSIQAMLPVIVEEELQEEYTDYEPTPDITVEDHYIPEVDPGEAAQESEDVIE